ncbi:MAG TPA: hypothetical protein VGI81_18555, partial [Tepidisphaeraceae bacterium]
ISIPASALSAGSHRCDHALPGQQDQRPTSPTPPRPMQAGAAAVMTTTGDRPDAADPRRAHAPSPQPPTRLPGPRPKWQQARLKQQMAGATGVRS